MAFVAAAYFCRIALIVVIAFSPLPQLDFFICAYFVLKNLAFCAIPVTFTATFLRSILIVVIVVIVVRGRKENAKTGIDIVKKFKINLK